MVPEYIYYSLGGGIFSVPLAGLGLLLLGLQIESWAYAALLLGRETAVRSNHETSARKEHVQSHRVRLTAMTQCSEQYGGLRNGLLRVRSRQATACESHPMVTAITDSLAGKDTLLRVLLRGSRDRMSFLRFPPLMDSRRDVAGGGV